MLAIRQNLFATRNCIPFKVQLNLKLVLEKWRATVSSDDVQLQAIEKILAKHPFLAQPIDGIAPLEEHQDFLEILLNPLLPTAGWSNALHSFCAPFTIDVLIAATDTYKKTFKDDKIRVSEENSLMKNTGMDARVLYAYKSILKKFYNFDIAVDLPIIICASNTQTKLNRYFKLTGNTQFVDVVNLAPLPDLDEIKLQKLLDQNFNLESWMMALPPENFLFRGVTLITLMDITTEESTKRLQFSLLHQEESNEALWFASIQQEMRNLFRLPQLRLGVATLQKNGKLNFSSNRKIWNSLLIRELPEVLQKEAGIALYQKVIQTGQTIILENLEDQKNDKIARTLVKMGFRNLLLAPLYSDGRVIGILELASPTQGDINGLSLFKINQVKPIFANALHRHLEEFENKVEAAMLEEFTAIHPAIQWRFREAAIHLLDKKRTQESIVFENLHPFYGSLDIRDSSKKRNQAILWDLMENLEMASEVLQQAIKIVSLNILEELVFHITQKIDKLKTQFSTEDEVGLAEFVQQKINPTVAHLGHRYPSLTPLATKYKQRINSESGIFDRHRMMYEETLAQVNRCMTSILDHEEKEVQKLIPCYFEKCQTDGVEYNIYMGKSIAPQVICDDLYIDDMRLRQLIWFCKIIRKVKVAGGCKKDYSKLKNNRVGLQIAPLILAYGSRITLKFQMDEKRLNVAGSYDIRYEIVKKRIDKSVIKDTKERLTQPGHIAIVYTNEKEADAYRRHFAYITAQGMIKKEWEELELEPLQGVKGLRAMRIKVI